MYVSLGFGNHGKRKYSFEVFTADVAIDRTISPQYMMLLKNSKDLKC